MLLKKLACDFRLQTGEKYIKCLSKVLGRKLCSRLRGGWDGGESI